MARRHLHPDFLTRDVDTRLTFECSKCGWRIRRVELELWGVNRCLGCGRHIARTISENRRALGLPALPAPDVLMVLLMVCALVVCVLFIVGALVITGRWALAGFPL